MNVFSYILIVFVLLAASCTKSKERSLQASKDYALILTDISHVAPLVIHTIQSEGYVLDRMRTSLDTLNSCATYSYVSGDTLDISNENVVVEVLFTQCVDFDGALKNGSLILNISNYFDVDSATCVINLTNFSVNNNIFSGTMNLKRNGSNKYELTANNVKVIVGTREITYQGTWHCDMGTGGDASYLYDNLLQVEEEGRLVDRYGATAMTIGTNLVRDLSCNWFGTGVVELEDEEGESQFLDYGNGSCDNKATSTAGENEVSFSIGG